MTTARSDDPAPAHFIGFRLHESHERVKAASPGRTALVGEFYCRGDACGWTTGPLQGGERIVYAGPDAGLEHELRHGTGRLLLGRAVVRLNRGQCRSGAGIGGDTLYRVPQLGWVGNYRPTWKNGEYRGSRPRWLAAVNPTGRDGCTLSRNDGFATAAAAMRWLLEAADAAPMRPVA